MHQPGHLWGYLNTTTCTTTTGTVGTVIAFLPAETLVFVVGALVVVVVVEVVVVGIWCYLNVGFPA